MTKIKNTKKGMAKKTLSVSLAVAMLATSNVPVWAAEFSDGSDAAFTSEVETPVVEEAVEAPIAEVASDYSVSTNMELKSDEWGQNLQLVRKSGNTDDADTFTVVDKNGLDKRIDKIEIYSGDDLVQTYNNLNITGAAAIHNQINQYCMNLSGYENSHFASVAIYVEGETSPIYTFTAEVKPVDIKNWNIGVSDSKKDYNGEVQWPDVTVTNSPAYGDKQATFSIKFDGATEAKNVGKYKFYVEGKGAYTGETPIVDTQVFEIEPCEAKEDNLTVTVSGTTTYNGTSTKPTVKVVDKLANVELPEELYTVTTNSNDAGEYTKDNITVSLKTSYTKEDNTVVENNFKNNANNEVPDACITGEYKVEKLDLSKLSDKYDVKVANKLVNNRVEASDITFVDRTTGKSYGYFDVIPHNETKIVTANNTSVGTGKITIKGTDLTEKNITGEFATTFKVVNATISAKDVEFPAGTKIGDTKLETKKTLEDANTDIQNALSGLEYTGSAIEPLKEAFSNLLDAHASTATEKKFVLGTDYDIVYANNVNANPNTDTDSSKHTSVKLVFKGEYTGTIEYEFIIAKAATTVTAADFEYEPGTNTYSLNAKVTTGIDEKDVPATEYTVTPIKKANKIGDEAVSVVVFNNTNYTGTGSSIPTISNLAGLTDRNPIGVTSDGRYCVRIKKALAERKLSNCTAAIEGDYVYTGEPISPKLIVKDGSITLVEGTDYEIVEKVGTNAGSAYVVIKGIGKYTGTLTVKYEIKKANLKDAIVESSKSASNKKNNYDVAYTGIAQEPDIEKVFIGKKELKPYDPVSKSGDYILTYDEDAIEIGTYNFTLTTVASSTNVEGTYQGTFKVVPNELTGAFVTKLGHTAAEEAGVPVDKTGAYYTGQEITIDSFKTKYVVIEAGTTNVLTEGKEYRLVYKNNIDAGIATVEAYGIGNYTHTDANGEVAPIAVMKFQIAPKALITNDMVLKINDVEYAGGLPVEPQVVILDAKGERLVQGVDYTVTTSVVEIGSYDQRDITINGKGAYLVGTNATTPDYVNNKMTFNGTDAVWKVTKKDMKNTVISVDKNDNVTVMNGSVVVPSTEYTVAFSADGKKVTVVAKEDSTHYTGSKEQAVDIATVGQAWISDVQVTGNKATVVLSGEVDNASGYDYVIATEDDLKSGRVDIVKNQIKTTADFQYVQKGTYYAYCHAWKRGEDGKKVFGEWSNVIPFTVGATTPAQPVITSVKRSGSTVTVTYTKAANADGYDVVLGAKTAVVSGEKRPVNYGTLVKKNVKGDTVTVTFKDVPAGTYYAGLHAWNRTSLDNKKVFSPWSNIKTVTVK